MCETELRMAAQASDGTSRALERVRARGGVEIDLRSEAGRTTPERVLEEGGYRAFFPAHCGRTEAVIVNTGGGMAGGDRVALKLSLKPRSHGLATTPSAERVYRSLGGAETTVDVTLAACDAACLIWMPQETILFSGARLRRTLEADLAPTATLLVSEIVVFGREAMGETLGDGLFSDSWQIRRGGELAFAEAVHLSGIIGAKLARPAVAGGARVAATLLFMAPHAEAHLERLRSVIGATDVRAAASAWNGHIVMRALGARIETVRRIVASAVETLTGERLPRVWGD